ncbi:hypothetical protein EUTSA_v10026267mg [Eutrema salsugineum]|uniref:Uncharacterized protein n=1 Tax=Eutrema salsugineum TaxID=72664 RepID=V4MER0_EUTSA|nr:hypothetical protein EUTSA_v10026267mg [Eutrema salsugineum]ESQ53742.1 hypothetical protein EUTSA_v10026267mg [Eutrema salsugineum]
MPNRKDECAGWTNERHNSYLDYLENSFVRQLYSLLGEETHRLSTPRDVQSNSLKSTDQFTVVQNGCLQKVNFGKKRPYLETSSEFNFQENSSDKAFIGTSMRNSLGHKYPAQSAAEASGQNFREEEEKEEKGCTSEVSRKRQKEANYDDSSLNDQVVP